MHAGGNATPPAPRAVPPACNLAPPQRAAAAVAAAPPDLTVEQFCNLSKSPWTLRFGAWYDTVGIRWGRMDRRANDASAGPSSSSSSSTCLPALSLDWNTYPYHSSSCARSRLALVSDDDMASGLSLPANGPSRAWTTPGDPKLSHPCPAPRPSVGRSACHKLGCLSEAAIWQASGSRNRAEQGRPGQARRAKRRAGPRRPPRRNSPHCLGTAPHRTASDLSRSGTAVCGVSTAFWLEPPGYHRQKRQDVARDSGYCCPAPSTVR
ncbi:uncharacterized protein PSFLO_03478 [Pseudozyma flocculosa]|uniref:Uncharacterized protein n=1 Tax=Pseudozyma flocculosa TaxID=84751 RepID=A0A5C3F406_9BASI|nr:uncharacterized protein PSFLO_03478 [Pseudozyma flocculosa]